MRKEDIEEDITRIVVFRLKSGETIIGGINESGRNGHISITLPMILHQGPRMVDQGYTEYLHTTPYMYKFTETDHIYFAVDDIVSGLYGIYDATESFVKFYLLSLSHQSDFDKVQNAAINQNFISSFYEKTLSDQIPETAPYRSTTIH